MSCEDEVCPVKWVVNTAKVLSLHSQSSYGAWGATTPPWRSFTGGRALKSSHTGAVAGAMEEHGGEHASHGQLLLSVVASHGQHIIVASHGQLLLPRRRRGAKNSPSSAQVLRCNAH